LDKQHSEVDDDVEAGYEDQTKSNSLSNMRVWHEWRKAYHVVSRNQQEEVIDEFHIVRDLRLERLKLTYHNDKRDYLRRYHKVREHHLILPVDHDEAQRQLAQHSGNRVPQGLGV